MTLRLARWPLRRRLVVMVVGLLAAGASVIGLVSTLALRGSLIDQLDDRVVAASQRSVAAARDSDVLSDLAVPGQGAGTVHQVRTPHLILSGYIDAEGVVERLNDTQISALADVAADGHIRTISLGSLRSHRVVAVPAAPTIVVVTGLSTQEVNAAVQRHVLTTIGVTLGGLVLVGVAGTMLVRRELRPLERVAATATRVSELPLDRGEVSLVERVPPADTDPATEVGRVGAALNRLLGHVESSLTARQQSETQVRRFVADASHELRTPLASIRGYAELVRHIPGDLPEDARRAMDRVESETLRMTSLVEDMLLLARLDAGRPLDRTPVDVVELVADAVADAHVAGPDHTWQLDLPSPDAGAPSAVVTGDEHGFRQVLANLLSNARVHTPAGTTVLTSVRSDGGTVAVTVRDDGPGIPEELRGHLFDRFARGDTARSPGTGSTGLGLSIADAVVRAHGGRIDVDGTPGATTFIVTLPAQPG